VSVETGPDGKYSISGLRGNVAVQVAKEGFYPLTSTIVLDRNGMLDFRLETVAPLANEGSDLVVGQPVTGTIGPKDLRCDRNWDANSPCRHYGFRPRITRTFTFVIRPFSCGELELHVFNASGDRVGYVDSKGFLSLDADLIAGGDYLIRLMAYYRCDLFELTLR